MGWDLDAFIEQLYRCEILPEHIVKEVCSKTKEVLLLEGNIRSVQAPVTVVGDVHGQFYDVLEIFRISGFCPDTNYVFLGDYVDRGYHSIETISLLCCLKLRYPSKITLVRGNHESRAVTQTYGFYAECIKRYDSPNVWNYFTDLFDYMVLGVNIEDSILGIHGGLSPSLLTLDQIRAIDRFQEIPHEGPMADLVWSDPVSSTISDDKGDFAISPRGAGYIFGREVTKKFLLTNGLGHICRAHQLCMEGYQILFDDMLSTVWSAPNYCYRAGNVASVLEIDLGLQRYFNVFGPCPTNFRGSNNGNNNSYLSEFTAGSLTTTYHNKLENNKNHINKAIKRYIGNDKEYLIDYVNDKYIAALVTPSAKHRVQQNSDDTNFSFEDNIYRTKCNMSDTIDDSGLSYFYDEDIPLPRKSSDEDYEFDKKHYNKKRFANTSREFSVFNPSNIGLVPSSASCITGWDYENGWANLNLDVKSNLSGNNNKYNESILSNSDDSGYYGTKNRQGITSVVDNYFGSSSSLSSMVGSTLHEEEPDHSHELANFSTSNQRIVDDIQINSVKQQPLHQPIIDIDVESKNDYHKLLKYIRYKQKSHANDHINIFGISGDKEFSLTVNGEHPIEALKTRVSSFKGGKWHIPQHSSSYFKPQGGYIPEDITGEQDFQKTELRNPFLFELDDEGNDCKRFSFDDTQSSKSSSAIILSMGESPEIGDTRDNRMEMDSPISPESLNEETNDNVNTNFTKPSVGGQYFM